MESVKTKKKKRNEKNGQTKNKSIAPTDCRVCRRDKQ